MQKADGLIAVDWGTTNRRAWSLDAGGRVAARVADDRGLRSVAPGGFPDAAGEIRRELGELPMLLAGMVGSNRGWVEAPYLPCPVSLDMLAERLIEVPGADAWIVPGASYADGDRCDVMRGEEVQILGMIAAGIAPADGLSCHPGTHAKWTRTERGAITSFRTVMTGEMFALLKTHSILAPQLGAPVEIGDAFLAGVDRSLARAELTAELFSLRARWLLEGLPHQEASAFASGLLIGADVRIGLSLEAGGGPVTLVGDRKLTALYAAALARARRDCREVDGEAAFLAGIAAIAERMR